MASIARGVAAGCKVHLDSGWQGAEVVSAPGLKPSEVCRVFHHLARFLITLSFTAMQQPLIA